jgi:hypothetical protein
MGEQVDGGVGDELDVVGAARQRASAPSTSPE